MLKKLDVLQLVFHFTAWGLGLGARKNTKNFFREAFLFFDLGKLHFLNYKKGFFFESCENF